MKYTSIQNMNEFTNNLKRFYPPDIKRIMEIECEVTEKIHGENFRVGKTADNRYFVGQKNLTFSIIAFVPTVIPPKTLP